MPNFMKSALRAVAGLAILGVGVAVMNVLIGMKPEPVISNRPVTPRAVRSLAAEVGPCVPKTPVEGRVESLYRMDIITETTGNLTIGGKEFREGTEYSAGEVMLRLDDIEAQNQLISQRGQFLQLLSNSLADLQLDFPAHWTAWESFTSEVNVEATLPALPEAQDDRERLFLANRGILTTYHAIRSAEERLDKYTITAPFDGVITLANVRPGGLVRAGQVAGVLVGNNAFEIKTAVHARYLTTVEQGDRVVFYDENGISVANGEVQRIAGHVDPTTQSASVFCRVRPVNGKTSLLRDGRFLSGEIESTPIDSALVVPLSWVGESGRLYAIADSKLVQREVDILFESRSEAIVQGIEPGTELLSEVLATAFDGMPVTTEAAE
jgi:multidrug efflux pump subunit AcrA (membrane-fusion protein)